MERVFNQNQVVPHVIEKGQDGNVARFTKIIGSGYKRACNAVVFFEKKGTLSEKILKKAFFKYLGVKKDAQRKIMEKIAQSMGIELTQPAGIPFLENIPQKNAEIEEEKFDKIYQSIYEIAEDELEFYLNYAEVAKDAKSRTLILMMADLSKEFLFDLKIWYLNHKTANRIFTF
jgi:hypothetical protein